MSTMKTCFPSKAIATALLSCLIAPGLSQTPDSRWHMRVTDLHGQVKVEATIRLTNDAAQSCMDAGWKRAAVEAKDAEAEDFFPLATPLAYKLEGRVLTLGRTYVCHGYLFLKGIPDGPVIRGTFDAVGWGRKQLGAFSLQEVP
jgi:hypothetical protein